MTIMASSALNMNRPPQVFEKLRAK